MLRTMTPDYFRQVALSLPKAEEVYRSGQSKFRVERRIFASLHGPGDSVATIHLTAEQQSTFIHASPRSFMPVAGGFGKLGETQVLLSTADEGVVERALAAAWKNVASKSLFKRIEKGRSL